MRTVHAGCAALSAVIAPTVAIATPATAHATHRGQRSHLVQTNRERQGLHRQRHTIAPNGSTGWHTQQGEIHGIIKSGVLTH
jgi:hypothetical protein